jgi:hypothetical protein
MNLPDRPKRSISTTWLMPLPRPRVPNPESPARALKEKMFVRVQIVDLQKVMIDILNPDLGSHPSKRKGSYSRQYTAAMIGRRGGR